MKKIVFIIILAVAVLLAVCNYNHYEIITHFKVKTSEIYATPLPGELRQCSGLEGAREHFKNKKVKFLVRCDIFEDGRRGRITEENKIKEYQRLSLEGYDLYEAKEWEYKNECEKEYYDVILLLLTEEQIETFKINEEYGYFFRFVRNGDFSHLDFDKCSKYNPF